MKTIYDIGMNRRGKVGLLAGILVFACAYAYVIYCMYNDPLDDGTVALCIVTLPLWLWMILYDLRFRLVVTESYVEHTGFYRKRIYYKDVWHANVESGVLIVHESRFSYVKVGPVIDDRVAVIRKVIEQIRRDTDVKVAGDLKEFFPEEYPVA